MIEAEADNMNVDTAAAATSDDPIIPASALLAKQREANGSDVDVSDAEALNDDDDVPVDNSPPPSVLDGDLSGDGSLVKKILRPGVGDALPRDGDKVSVHYVGTLQSDGSKFDSSRDRAEPFVVTLNRATSSSVIRGWDEGIRTMKKGELATFTIAAHKAYGAAGSPPKIPANATLVFEIECLDFTRMNDVTPNKDGGVQKEILVKAKASEYKTPADCSVCTIKIDGGAPITFTVDEPNEAIVPGVEVAVRSMKLGEKAKVQINDAYAGGRGAFTCEIELVSFEKEKESWDMSNAERIEAATKKRLAGNGFFEKADFARAKRRYDASVSLIQYDSAFSDDEKKAAKLVRLPCHLNLSAVALKMKDFKTALEQANKALEIERANVKALFRRSQVHIAEHNYDLAANDLNTALQVEPTNVALLKERTRLDALQKEKNQRDKNLFAKMLGAK